MKKTDLSSLLQKLEAGELPAKLEYVCAQDSEALELIDSWCMSQSLMSSAVPSEAGLKSVLAQGRLLEESKDEDQDWGVFFKATQMWRWVAPSLLVALFFGVGVYEWVSPTTLAPVASNESTASSEVLESEMDVSGMSRSVPAPVLSSTTQETTTEMESMAADWEASFETELAEFYEMDEQFENFKSQSLFSVLLKNIL